MPDDCGNVFVYGTLRKGHLLHEHLPPQTFEFLGEGSIQGRLYDLEEYPGAVPSGSPMDRIHGELYRLREPARQLRDLDQLEECDAEAPDRSLFLRRIVEVRMPAGEIMLAWAYFLPRRPADAPVIPGGDYSRRTSANSSRADPEKR